MKILFLTSWIPNPQSSSGCPRYFSFGTELKKLGHDVSLLSMDRGRLLDIHNDIFSNINLLPSPPYGSKTFIGRLKQALMIQPGIFMGYRFPDYFNLIQETIAAEVDSVKPDVVICHNILMEQFIPIGLPNLLVDLVDSMSLLTNRRLNIASKVPSKVLAARTYLETQRYEKRLMGRRRNVMVISKVDADFLEQVSGVAPRYILPNGLAEEQLVEVVPEESTGNQLMFSGVMNYAPNRDAANFLAQEIFPLVREKISDAELLLVGKHGDTVLREVARLPGVRVTGFVDSLSPYFSEASVYVSPLRFGAGMKNKILSAFSTGTPVVGTPLSVDGIEVKDGEHLELARSAEDFAEKIIGLLQDRKRSRGLAVAAHRKVLENYRWEGITKKLESILEDLCEPSK